MKKSYGIVAIMICITSFINAQKIVYINNGPSYYQDITPEYKKSPSGYLTAFAQGYFPFDAFGLTYALGDAGSIIAIEKLHAIKDRLSHFRTHLAQERNRYLQHQAPYHRPHMYWAAAQFSLASCLASACLYFCLKVDRYRSDEQYLPVLFSGLFALPLLPLGIKNSIKAHPVLHAHELGQTIYGVDEVLKLLTAILEKRATEK